MSTRIKKIEVLPYDPFWPQLYEEESAKIKGALGLHCLEIHHIGSTSVPGLCSKRDIDILCIVDALDKSLALEDIGYIYKGEFNIPLRNFFSKNTERSKVNLHVVERNHPYIALSLLFRDYLRANENARTGYAQLKMELLKDPKSFEKEEGRFSRYGLRKNVFIKELLEKAGFEEIALYFCMHDEEWDTYHRIRKEQIFNPSNIAYDPHHPTIKAANHRHLILYKGTNITSVAHVELLNENEVALRLLATDEPCKNQGYAAHMLRLIEEWLRCKKYKVIKTHAASEVVGFYRKQGYQNMPFDDQSVFSNCVDLGKELTSL